MSTTHPTTSMKGKSRHEGITPQNILKVDNIPEGTFPVIDPYSKKLFVPLESMMDTRAMHREGVPSLCRIFLEGRCRQGTNCFQAHADTSVIQRLRSEALSQPSCCMAHGAPSSLGDIPEDLLIALKDDDESVVQEISVSEICVTNGFMLLFGAQRQEAELMNTPVVCVPVSALCRLHSGHNGSPCCRFEAECNFVHVCREVVARIAAGKVTEMASTPTFANPPDIMPLEVTVSVSSGRRQMGSSPMIRLSNSTGASPLGPPSGAIYSTLAATAPTGKEPSSPMMSRSVNSTASGTVWRHNPYASSQVSSVIET
ncbi:hypothetical protein AGDE_08827 [Angomonas deanei]|nr:hypothetical protein AGDE_08827 [Angomonas deanei]|eukprot:EPY32170.1 hypothetical protein AGDE_08827 [Angomonas deanei]